MKIRMLKTVRGSPDGTAVLLYEIGSEHDLAASPREEDLAGVFLREGWAERTDVTVPSEVRAMLVPENKAIDHAPEHKGRRRKG